MHMHTKSDSYILPNPARILNGYSYQKLAIWWCTPSKFPGIILTPNSSTLLWYNACNCLSAVISSAVVKDIGADDDANNSFNACSTIWELPSPRTLEEIVSRCSCMLIACYFRSFAIRWPIYQPPANGLFRLPSRAFDNSLFVWMPGRTWRVAAWWLVQFYSDSSWPFVCLGITFMVAVSAILFQSIRRLDRSNLWLYAVVLKTHVFLEFLVAA